MQNTLSYNEKYSAGYGGLYPEGHVIRFYEKFLKYEFGIDGSNEEKLLDFGCGNGTHPNYFASKGFEVFGVDVSEVAIKRAKNLPKVNKKNFHVIPEGADIRHLFSNTFDIIFSNQALYYLDNTQLKNTLHQMDSLLSPDGIVFFTMIGTQNYYYDYSRENRDGLRTVELNGRLNETTNINFVDSEESLINVFSMFNTNFVGHYDCLMREGSGFHWKYIGVKR